jgi:hypothetical protein
MSDETKNKARARNALVHGLYAKDILLPWESERAFERLHSELKVEFRPSGRAEKEAVLDLAQLHWIKHNILRMRQSVVLNDPFTLDILATGKKSWRGIRKQLRAGADGIRSIQAMAENELAKLQSQMQRLERQIEKSSDREEIKLLQDKISICRRQIADHVLPLIQKLREAPNAEQAFDKVYAPESMERLVRLEAMIDARISKVLGRLVGLKEFKRTPAGAGTLQLSDAGPEPKT